MQTKKDVPFQPPAVHSRHSTDTETSLVQKKLQHGFKTKFYQTITQFFKDQHLYKGKLYNAQTMQMQYKEIRSYRMSFLTDVLLSSQMRSQIGSPLLEHATP